MKKKIVFVINSLSCGGAERVLINIANNLNTKLFDVTIITTFSGGVFESLLSDSINIKSVSPFKNKYLNILVYKVLSKLCSPNALYKMHIKDIYDIEIAFLEGLPTKIVSGSNNKKSKKIAWVHTDIETHRGSDYCFKDQNEQNNCYSKFDKIICVSDSVANIFKKRFEFIEKVTVSLNPIDERMIISMSKNNVEQLKVSDNIFNFVAIGRLVKQKGFDRLIRVISLLVESGLDVLLHIIGEGVERPLLESLIKEYGLENNVILLGYKDNPYTYLIQADAFVLSSRIEGYPSVLVESLILGIPVVAVECSGVSEILNNGEFGLLLENSDSELYKGMKKLIEDSNLLKYYRTKAIIKGNYFKITKSIKELEGLLNDTKC